MISLVVITKNEEKRIQAALESASWVDEILILDNGSSDKTLEIAGSYTSKIFKFDNLDFASIRNKGMDLAKGDWVLYLDSDERITSELKSEIIDLVSQDQTPSALAISRQNIIFGEKVTYGPFWPDWVVRLLRKSTFKKWVGEVHEYPEFDGQLEYSKNSLIHLTHRDLDHVVNKSLAWSKLDAKLRLESGHPKMNSLRFIRILITEIFYQGVIRKGFFNGSVGTVDAILQSFSLFMTYVRLWEMQKSKDLEQLYDEIDEELLKQKFKTKSI